MEVKSWFVSLSTKLKNQLFSHLFQKYIILNIRIMGIFLSADIRVHPTCCHVTVCTSDYNFKEIMSFYQGTGKKQKSVKFKYKKTIIKRI